MTKHIYKINTFDFSCPFKNEINFKRKEGRMKGRKEREKEKRMKEKRMKHSSFF
jgi:hypothetical protein